MTTYLDHKFPSNRNNSKDVSNVYYFKLPCIGNILHHIKNKVSKLFKAFCKVSFVVYKFICASCSSSYISETCHFKTTIEENIKKDNKLHIFKHLHSTTTCFDSYNSLSFKIFDEANSKFGLNIKETLHIIWTKPNLNTQQSL